MTAFYPLPLGGDAQHRPDTHLSMALVSFKPVVKGTLRAFVTVRLPIGLTIADIQVCTSHGKAWASLPAKPVLDESGRQVERAGKRQYVSLLSWSDRATRDRWSDAVVELVRAAHPEALAGEALP